jgi:Ni,Fe-hydrogenase III large subunit
MAITVVPFGPQHPILAEPIRYMLKLEEEKVIGVDFEIGFMHRGIEKAMESDYMKAMFISERVCGICSAVHALSFIGAVEKADDIEVPDRARYIRTIILELERVHSHLLWVGVAADAVGFQNLFMLAWREREAVMDLMEAIAGNRVHKSFYVPGGVRGDIDERLAKKISAALDSLERSTEFVAKAVKTDKTLINRVKGIGIMDKALGLKYGVVGPNARASGIRIDARLDRYEAFKWIDFEPIVLEGGDNLARVLVRVLELFQSIKIMRECLKRMEPGPFTSDFKGVLKGEASYRLEAPRGELFYYVKGNGTKGLERVKIRTPTLASVSVMRELLLGEEFADIPVTVLSFDPCMSCQDR